MCVWCVVFFLKCRAINKFGFSYLNKNNDFRTEETWPYLMIFDGRKSKVGRSKVSFDILYTLYANSYFTKSFIGRTDEQRVEVTRSNDTWPGWIGSFQDSCKVVHWLSRNTILTLFLNQTVRTFLGPSVRGKYELGILWTGPFWILGPLLERRRRKKEEWEREIGRERGKRR